MCLWTDLYECADSPDTLQEQHDVALLLVVKLSNVLVGTPVIDQYQIISISNLMIDRHGWYAKCSKELRRCLQLLVERLVECEELEAAS